MKRLLSFVAAVGFAALIANAIPAGAALRAVTSVGSGVTDIACTNQFLRAFTSGVGTCASVSAAQVSGLATVATSGSASDLGTGTLPVARLSLSPITNAIGADVPINNTASYITGPTIAQGTSGNWWATGHVLIYDASSLINMFCVLTDGTTNISSGQATTTAVNQTVNITLAGFINAPAGNIRVNCKSNTSTTGVIAANNTSLGKDSTVSAIRIN